ncbi:MAG: hypothetical protein AB1477_02540 [Acidobacteriota bacterium]|jgi:hypothetical protein
MRCLFLQVLILVASGIVLCQQPQGSPAPQNTPQPIPQTSPSPRTGGQSSSAGVSNENPRLFSPPFSDSIQDSDRIASRIIALRQFTAPLYRKPTDKELKVVAPGTRWTERYAFPGDKQGGVVRLLPDYGCAKNTRVVYVSEQCLKLSMPGAANSFSFRTRSYRIRRLADIALDGDEFVLTGIFMDSVLLPLNDVDFETLVLSSPGVSSLNLLTPSQSFDQIDDFEKRFQNKSDEDSFRYSRRVVVKVGASYAYRGIAYRGRILRAAGGITYNELDFDKRRDILVVFNVLERDKDGSVTIVYRVLKETTAPKLKVPSSAGRNSSVEER